jgi:hypothetical protein
MCNCKKKKMISQPEPTPIPEEYKPLTPEDFFENSEYNGQEPKSN